MNIFNNVLASRIADRKATRSKALAEYRRLLESIATGEEIDPADVLDAADLCGRIDDLEGDAAAIAKVFDIRRQAAEMPTASERQSEMKRLADEAKRHEEQAKELRARWNELSVESHQRTGIIRELNMAEADLEKRFAIDAK